MSAGEPADRSRALRRLARFATILTLGIFVMVGLLCQRCMFHNPHDPFEQGAEVGERVVHLLGTFAMAFLVIAAGGFRITAWTAFVGLMLWFAGLALTILHGPAHHTGPIILLVGSALIVASHLRHLGRSISRHWERFFITRQGTRFILLLVTALIAAAIALAIFPPADSTHAPMVGDFSRLTVPVS